MSEVSSEGCSAWNLACIQEVIEVVGCVSCLVDPCDDSMLVFSLSELLVCCLVSSNKPLPRAFLWGLQPRA